MLILLGGVLLLLIGAGGVLISFHARSAALVGPTVRDSPRAPDFALTDQNGQRVALTALRGKVTALTFLYTNCPDVCPLIAGKLAQADQQLGGDRAGAALLAVSVDPAHDSAGAVQAFDRTHGLTDANWHYLIGDQAALTPVWKAYYVGADAASETPAGQVSQPTAGLVNHTAIIYIIDKSGRLRLALDANFAVADFVHDVRALLHE